MTEPILNTIDKTSALSNLHREVKEDFNKELFRSLINEYLNLCSYIVTLSIKRGDQEMNNVRNDLNLYISLISKNEVTDEQIAESFRNIFFEQDVLIKLDDGVYLSNFLSTKKLGSIIKLDNAKCRLPISRIYKEASMINDDVEKFLSQTKVEHLYQKMSRSPERVLRLNQIVLLLRISLQSIKLDKTGKFSASKKMISDSIILYNNKKTEKESVNNNTSPAAFSFLTSILDIGSPLLTKTVGLLNAQSDFEELKDDIQTTDYGNLTDKVSTITDKVSKYTNENTFKTLGAFLKEIKDNPEYKEHANKIISNSLRHFIDNVKSEEVKSMLRRIETSARESCRKIGEEIPKQYNVDDMLKILDTDQVKKLTNSGVF